LNTQGVKDIAAATDMDNITKKVTNRYKVFAEMFYNSKRRSILAKKVAIYLAKKLTPLKNREIGDKFGITYSAVSKVVSDVEDIMLKNKRTRNEIGKLISHFKV